MSILGLAFLLYTVVLTSVCRKLLTFEQKKKWHYALYTIWNASTPSIYHPQVCKPTMGEKRVETKWTYLSPQKCQTTKPCFTMKIKKRFASELHERH